jgi:hypothetical protein
MWTSFETLSGSHAVKISVGNVNALTGQHRSTMDAGKQDYLAVNPDNGQLYVLIFSPFDCVSESTNVDGLWVQIVNLELARR